MTLTSQCYNIRHLVSHQAPHSGPHSFHTYTYIPIGIFTKLTSIHQFIFPIIKVFVRGNFHLSDNIFQDLIEKLSNNLSSILSEKLQSRVLE